MTFEPRNKRTVAINNLASNLAIVFVRPIKSVKCSIALNVSVINFVSIMS